MSYNQIKYAIYTWKWGSLYAHFFLLAPFTISLLANPELQGGWEGGGGH